MSAVEKTLVIAGIARGMYGRWRFQRLLSGVMVVTGLTVISSMLVGTMLIGGFYAAYFAFLHYGWEPQIAILLTGALVTSITATFITLTVMCLRRLRQMPMASRTSEVVDAFFDGLMTEDAR